MIEIDKVEKHLLLSMAVSRHVICVLDRIGHHCDSAPAARELTDHTGSEAGASMSAVLLAMARLSSSDVQLWTKVNVFRLCRILSREVEEIKTLQSPAMIEHQA